ncbi:hypothetical protein RIVM261_027780 [Rivularia sp. IAM M-261]|nr:hypothetical protein CAL7716_013120 [Calothrix sp. PCC 7716]GJD17822.1 hypothetical protein RIVM261_027780 [Rivularia sp. IAM M-261]
MAISISVIPYFWNNPFSKAIIIGAESVKAINPSLALVVSTLGAFATGVKFDAGFAVLVVPPELLSALDPFDEQPFAIMAPAAVIPAVIMNFLLERLVILFVYLLVIE